MSEPRDRSDGEAATPAGSAPGAGNPAPPNEVRAMFDRIAGRYEPLNAVISGFQEPRWRRRLVAATVLGTGMRALDVASGTGTVARDLARVVGPSGRVLGVDISAGMLDRARNHTRVLPNLDYVVGDAMDLPVEDGTFDAATIAFGMRNLPDYRRGFAEMRRAVRPGGIVACLEIARPSSVIGRIGRTWFEAIVPRIGQLAGQGDAYRYLVRSVRAYPPPEQIAEIMREAGLVDVAWTPLTFGMVTLHTGRRP